MTPIEQKYYHVMELLRNTRMEHGLCQPRSRRACTHCNAVDGINKLIDEYQGAPIHAQGGKSQDTPETGWLVENGNLTPLYRTMDEEGIRWTGDPNEAIRFARREDAEKFAAGDEDAWRIVEHMWLPQGGMPPDEAGDKAP